MVTYQYAAEIKFLKFARIYEKQQQINGSSEDK